MTEEKNEKIGGIGLGVLPTDKMSYIARKPCGCIVMATIDNLEHRRDVAKEVAKAIRQGYIIERVTADYVRENWLCYQHEGEHIQKEVLERMQGSFLKEEGK